MKIKKNKSSKERYDYMTGSEQRADSGYDSLPKTHMGSGRDKGLITITQVSDRRQDPEVWYGNLGLFKKLVDEPIDDCLKSGWTLSFPNDPDGKTADHYSRRMEELKIYDRIGEWLKEAALNDGGAVIYIGAVSGTAITNPGEPMASDSTVTHLNVLKNVVVREKSDYQLSPDYHELTCKIKNDDGKDQPIDGSRFIALIHNYRRNRHRNETAAGFAPSRKIIKAVQAYEAVTWALRIVFQEVGHKVIKTEMVHRDKAVLADYVRKIQDVISANTIIPIGLNEELTQQLPMFTGWKDVLDFVLENLALASDIPKARLVGLVTGQLAGGPADQEKYAAAILSKQETYITPALDRIIEALSREPGAPEATAWTIEYVPLYVASRKEIAETELIEAQADDLRCERQILEPDEVRARRFPELPAFNPDPTQEDILDGVS